MPASAPLALNAPPSAFRTSAPGGPLLGPGGPLLGPGPGPGMVIQLPAAALQQTLLLLQRAASGERQLEDALQVGGRTVFPPLVFSRHSSVI